MQKNLKQFGETLKQFRIRKQLSLRDICGMVDYDPSNWSKIERGVIPPPSDEAILKKWAQVLGVGHDWRRFVDDAKVAQGVIPQDILSQSDMVKCLPAFFRTLRNKKPTREYIKTILELLKNA